MSWFVLSSEIAGSNLEGCRQPGTYRGSKREKRRRVPGKSYLSLQSQKADGNMLSHPPMVCAVLCVLGRSSFQGVCVTGQSKVVTHLQDALSVKSIAPQMFYVLTVQATATGNNQWDDTSAQSRADSLKKRGRFLLGRAKRGLTYYIAQKGDTGVTYRAHIKEGFRGREQAR